MNKVFLMMDPELFIAKAFNRASGFDVCGILPSRQHLLLVQSMDSGQTVWSQCWLRRRIAP